MQLPPSPISSTFPLDFAGPMVASVRLEGELFARSQSYNHPTSFELQHNNVNISSGGNHCPRSGSSHPCSLELNLSLASWTHLLSVIRVAWYSSSLCKPWAKLELQYATLWVLNYFPKMVVKFHIFKNLRCSLKRGFGVHYFCPYVLEPENRSVIGHGPSNLMLQIGEFGVL